MMSLAKEILMKHLRYFCCARREGRIKVITRERTENLRTKGIAYDPVPKVIIINLFLFRPFFYCFVCTFFLRYIIPIFIKTVSDGDYNVIICQVSKLLKVLLVIFNDN